MRLSRLTLSATAAVVVALGGCKGPNSPSARNIQSFIAQLSAFGTGVQGIARSGPPPSPQPGGPITTPNGGSSVASGSASSYSVAGSAPFQKVFVSVSSAAGQTEDHIELTLPSAVTTVNLAVSYAESIPRSTFTLKFQTATAAGVVGPEAPIDIVVVSSVAAPRSGVSISASGAIRLLGLGTDSGRGVGRYGLGDCTDDGVSTTCVVAGAYTETAGSQPGAGGSYILTLTYSGTGLLSPFLARASATDPNSVDIPANIQSGLAGAVFTLSVSPSYGGLFIGTIPPFDPGIPNINTLAFNAPLAPGSQTCVGGTPPSCTIPDALPVFGVLLTGTIRQDGFTFTLPSPGVTTSELRR